MIDLRKILPAIVLCLASSFAMAADEGGDTLDIRDNPSIKLHGIKNYTASYETRSITIKLGLLQQFFVYDHLKDEDLSHLAFYSRKLGKPDEENCALINLDEEVIQVKQGVLTTVFITNAQEEDIARVQIPNCLVVDRAKLNKKSAHPDPP